MQRPARGEPDLPELSPEEDFSFACHAGLDCFNRCCRQLALPLTPYDAIRLRRNLGLAPGEFIEEHARMETHARTGLPLAWLRMAGGPDGDCPFLRPSGCSVYADRPGACRAYPLGRGTSMGANGMRQRLYLVRERHCHGFGQGPAQKPRTWLDSQGHGPYAAASDRLARLMAMISAGGAPVSPAQARMARVCLYAHDRLREIISGLNIFRRIRPGNHDRRLILDDSTAGDAAALDFGLDWLEMSIFGRCPGFF